MPPAASHAPLVSSDLSGESFDLTWSPATQILFQQPGNRNYYELDPETRARTPLAQEPGRLDFLAGPFA